MAYLYNLPVAKFLLLVAGVFCSQATLAQDNKEHSPALSTVKCAGNNALDTACLLPDDVFGKKIDAKVSGSNWQYFAFEKEAGREYVVRITPAKSSEFVSFYWWDSEAVGGVQQGSYCGAGSIWMSGSYTGNERSFVAEKPGYTAMLLCTMQGQQGEVSFVLEKK